MPTAQSPVPTPTTLAPAVRRTSAARAARAHEGYISAMLLTKARRRRAAELGGPIASVPSTSE